LQDIFISYSRLDRDRAGQLVAALRAAGRSIWIDSTGIEEGRAYDRQIEAALSNAQCVIVLWSRNSVNSDWVRNEAAEALRAEKLLPLLTDDSVPPLQFRSVQAIDFREWGGSNEGREFQQLQAAIDRRLQEGTLPAGPRHQPVEAGPEVRGWRRVAHKLGLSFEDAKTERQFATYYFDEHIQQARMYILILAVFYGLFGVFDTINGGNTNGKGLALVVAPILVGAFLISLWPPLRRIWRGLLLSYAVIAIGLMLFASYRVASTGNAADDGRGLFAGVVAIVAFYGLAPFPFVETLLLCLFPLLVTLINPALFGGTASDVQSSFQVSLSVVVMAAVAAWWRERRARRAFMESARRSTPAER
jgi:hypothetical protein